MKESLNLKSKSGIHILISALEERGFIKRLAHKAQTDSDIRENFGRKSVDLVTRFTDDAVNAVPPRLTQGEAVALKELFTDNVLKRPLQDFIGLMGTRGFAANNP